MPADLPEAMLVDLDDTIISYSTYAEPCWAAACRRFAGHVDGCTADELYNTLCETRTWFWGDPERHRINRLNMRRSQQRVVDHTLRRLGVENWDLATQIADAFIRERRKAIKPFPGAIETLKALRERNVRLALITNGASGAQREKIERFGLEPCFDAILVEGELGYGKPDERIYRDALDRLDAEPAGTWIVGDNLEWEVAVPGRLGFYTVWHDPLGKGLSEGTEVRPDRIINALSELV